MSPTTGSYESEGVAERRAQRELTERVGVRLVRRSKSHNLEWRTWTGPSRRHRGSIRAGRNGASESPPARLAPAQAGEDIPDGLDWDAFSTRYFPGRRRHDLEVISAYAAYQQR
jgi:hypothetical protein